MRPMILASLVLAAPGVCGDRDAFVEGVRLLRAGKPVQAFAKLSEAEKSYGDEAPPSLLADLAIAAWKTGERGKAESYAERAAARSGGFRFLRDMLIGATRLDEAVKAATDPQGGEKALAAVERAIAAFESALTQRAESGPARRNLERALRLKEELEKRQKEEKKNEKDNKDKKKEKDEKDKQKQEQEQKKDEQQQDQQKQEQEEQKQQQKKQDDAEKKKAEQQKDEQQKAQPAGAKDQKSDKKPDEKSKKQMLLTPEQLQRLKRALEDLEKKKRALRMQLRPRHVPGKKDW